jgi:hypothetical protein
MKAINVKPAKASACCGGEMKILRFKSKTAIDENDFSEFKKLLADNQFKTVIVAGLKIDGDVFTEVVGDSVLELCGLVDFLDKDIKQQIEI